jgi:hypothetical protein
MTECCSYTGWFDSRGNLVDGKVSMPAGKRYGDRYCHFNQTSKSATVADLNLITSAKCHGYTGFSFECQETLTNG